MVFLFSWTVRAESTKYLRVDMERKCHKLHVPVPARVFPEMRIRVQRASTQPLELVLSPDSNVKHVKEMMLFHDFPSEVHLIYAGQVLADTMALSELLIQDSTSFVWALLPSHALASVDFDLKDIHRIVLLTKFQVKEAR